MEGRTKVNGDNNKQINLLGYVTITGIIKCITGIHIGGSADSIDKGGIDSPVIRNPVTNQPYIPGSSLRGKMRCFLEKWLGKELDELVSGIYIHNGKKNNSAESSEICRIFGTTYKDCVIPSSLIVRDCLMNPKSLEDYMDGKLPITEAKTETAIDRITSAAHPRTIERVPAGAEFEFELIYKVQSNDRGQFPPESDTNVREDIKKIVTALKFIEKYDGIGGHTARGYGHVKFIVNSIEAIKTDLKTKAFESDRNEYQKPEEEASTNFTDLVDNHVQKISFLE